MGKLPDDNYIEKYYRKNYRKENTGEKVNDIVLKTEKNRGKNVINFITNNFDLKTITNALDIGCSTGTLLEMIYEKTDDVNLDGIELNESFCKYINKNKKYINVINEKIEKYSKYNNSKYDLITMVHVLEHLPNPSNEIANIYLLLKDDGLFYLEVPNLLTPYNNLWKEYFQLYHISYFTSINLAYLLEKIGFEIIKSHNPSGTSIGFICKKKKRNKNISLGIKANYKFLYFKLYIYIIKYYFIQLLILIGVRKVVNYFKFRK